MHSESARNTTEETIVLWYNDSMMQPVLTEMLDDMVISVSKMFSFEKGFR